MIASSDSEIRQEDALSALLFSVAAMEAFINELTTACRGAVKSGHANLSLVSFAWGLQTAEDSNATTKYKFEMAHLLLTGSPPNRGSQLFADFYVLFGLRNDIMHVKRPSTIGIADNSLTTQLPDRVTYLSNRGLTRRMAEGYRTHWLIHLMTARVAWWACNSASEICLHIAQLVPDSTISKSYAEAIRESLK